MKIMKKYNSLILLKEASLINILFYRCPSGQNKLVEALRDILKELKTTYNIRKHGTKLTIITKMLLWHDFLKGQSIEILNCGIFDIFRLMRTIEGIYYYEIPEDNVTYRSLGLIFEHSVK